MANLTNVSFKQMSRAKFNSIVPSNDVFYRVVNVDTSEDLYIGSRKLNNAQDLLDSLYANRINYRAESGVQGEDGYSPALSVKDALDELYALAGGGSGGGSISDLIEAAIYELDAKISNDGGQDSIATTADSSSQRKVLTEITETNGVLSGGKHIELSDVAVTGAAEDVTVDNTNGTFESVTTDLQSILEELADKASSATPGGATVTLVSRHGNEVVDSDNTAEYVFYQGLTVDDVTDEQKALKEIGSINIAKDMVATSGTLVQPTDLDPIEIDGNQVTSGTYIEMTIANGDPFYINVADLVSYATYTNEAPGNLSGIVEEIYVTDVNHTITLSIGEISASKIVYQNAVDGVGQPGDPDYVAPIAKETVAQAIARIDANAGSTEDIENAIGDLDSKVSSTDNTSGVVTPTADVSTQRKVLTEITETDGVISDAKYVELDDIAVNGLVWEVVEDD